MSISSFIARRLSITTVGNSFSRTIMRLAIVSIALSIGVMIIGSSIIYGFKKQIRDKIFDFWGHIQVVDSYVSQDLEVKPIDFSDTLVDKLGRIGKLSYSVPMKIAGIPVPNFQRHKRSKGRIQKIYPFIQYPAIIRTKEAFEGILLKSVDASYDTSFFDKYLVVGRGLSIHDSIPHREIVISQSTANRLRLKVQDHLILNFLIDDKQIQRRFTVTGIYKTGLTEYDRRVALIEMNTLQQILGWSPEMVTGLEIKLDNIDDLRVYNQYIYQEVLPPDLYTQTVERKAAPIFDWLNLQDINEVVILGLMLLVCIFNLITAFLIMVLERTHMIGILKALGATNGTIQGIFILLSAKLLLYGMIAGNLFAFAVCFIQKTTGILTLSEKDYYLAVVPIEFNWSMIVLINLLTLFIATCFLILPSWLITRISPTKAIRFS